MSTEERGGVEKSPLLSKTGQRQPSLVDNELAAMTNRNADRRAVTVDDDSSLEQSTPSSSVKIRSRNVEMPASSEGYTQDQYPYANQSTTNQPEGALYPNPQPIHPLAAHSPPGQFDETNMTRMYDNETFDGSEDTPANAGGPTVICRVCEAEISLEGKNSQHVVRCHQCNEVTPIRAAPPGKKYVRCPCNCLLVCKATSTRIACPRQNCRRVITLASGPPNSGVPGTAIRAPVGTCRVQCSYCQEIFMFNTLTNQLAICPHCRKSSSVGAAHARARSLLYFIGLMVCAIILIGVAVAISRGQEHFFMWVFLVALIGATLFLAYRFIFFWRIKISQVLGPL